MALRWIILLIAAAVTMVASMSTISTPASTTPFVGVKEPNCSEGEGNESTCHCDPACARYGDCCRSSQYFIPEEQRLGASQFTCMNLFNFGVNVMAKCPPDWQDTATRTHCEHPYIPYQDPILDAPVTSTSTNTTYRNWYCASCYQDLEPEKTIIWNPNFQCATTNNIVPELSGSVETLANHLTYNTTTMKWNYRSRETNVPISFPGYMPNTYNNTTNPKEYECDLSFIAPVEALRKQRWCNTHIISSCADNWTNTGVQRQCEAYTAHVCSGWKTYRNYYCVICNNFEELEECYHPTYAPPIGPVDSFSVILDWKRLKRNACGPSEMYDPMARICRKVYS